MNLWLQSSDVQGKLREAVLEATGLPVKVNTTYYTPWGGITLKRISIEDQAEGSANFLDLDAIRLRIRILPLWEKRFVVRRIEIDSPRITWRQDPEGIWKVPAAQTPLADASVDPNTDVSPSANRGPVPSEPTAPAPAGDPPPPAAASSPVRTDFQVEVEELTLSNGSISILSRLADPLVLARGIECQTDLEGPNAEGTIVIRKIQFGKGLIVEDVEGRYGFDGKVLQVAPLTGTLASGRIRATMELLPRAHDLPFKATVDLEGASIRELLKDAELPATDAGGTVSGSFDLRGLALDDETFAGAASLRADQGRLRPVKFIRQVGELLRIDELQLLELHDAGAEFSIAERNVNIDRIHLVTENVILQASGPVLFTGELDLNARIVVNEALQRELRGLLGSNFASSDDFPGSKELDFEIGGSLERPTTDLMEKLTGFRIRGDVGGLLRQFLNAVPPPPAEPSE